MKHRPSYDPACFAPLAAIEDRHFWFRARNRVIGALARQLTAGLPAGCRVLEVGCGTGNVLRMLEQTCRHGVVVGMDAFAEGLEYARRRTRCPLVRGDMRAPPFRAGFEVIGLFDVLEHLPDDVQALRDLHALLAPGGSLVLTVPAHPSLWSYFDKASGHYRRYRTAELEQKLAQAGYQVRYLTPYMASLFPLVWIGRRLAALFDRRKQGSGPGAADRSHDLAVQELRVTPVINGLLTFVLAQETRVILRRRRLPFGTSLLAVAGKSVPEADRRQIR